MLSHLLRTGLNFIFYLSAITLPLNGNGAYKFEMAGHIVNSQGSVWIRRDQRSKEPIVVSAKGGDPLLETDLVITESTGRVDLLLRDDSLIELGPESLIRIDQYISNSGADREVEINMPFGSTRIRISKKVEKKGRFCLRTPAMAIESASMEIVAKSEDRNFEGGLTKLSLLALKDPKLASTGTNSSQYTQVTVIKGRASAFPIQAATSLRGAEMARSSWPSTTPSELAAGSQLSSQQGQSAPGTTTDLSLEQINAVSLSINAREDFFRNWSGAPARFNKNHGIAVTASGGESLVAPPILSIKEVSIPGAFSVSSPTHSLPKVQALSNKMIGVSISR
jgi:hypothetical protein